MVTKIPVLCHAQPKIINRRDYWRCHHQIIHTSHLLWSSLVLQVARWILSEGWIVIHLALVRSRIYVSSDANVQWTHGVLQVFMNAFLFKCLWTLFVSFFFWLNYVIFIASIFKLYPFPSKSYLMMEWAVHNIGRLRVGKYLSCSNQNNFATLLPFSYFFQDNRGIIQSKCVTSWASLLHGKFTNQVSVRDQAL